MRWSLTLAHICSYVSSATYPIDMSVERNIKFTLHIEMTCYEIELTFPAVFEVTRNGYF